MPDLVDVTAPLEQEGTRSTVRAWLARVGESVGVNDPLVELETDKVTVEVPAPVAGVLDAQLVEPGAEVPPGALLARIREGGEGERPSGETPVEGPITARVDTEADPAPVPGAGPEHRLSPSVRRALKHRGLDPSRIRGTGRGGRITRADVDAYQPGTEAPSPAPTAVAGAGRRIPHSPTRRAIAEHMARSVATAPHVTALFEADLSAVLAHRAATRAGFEAQGTPLTITAYLVSACVEAMRAVPQVNARWHEDALELVEDLNIGVGTATPDGGLVVPVVHRAQTLSLLGVAQRLADLTVRARTNKLKPEDVRGGTFSISNHGVSGSLVATPIIINQPQIAILGVGKLEKRVVVREVMGADAIQVRPMAYVSLTIDHRALDGQQTNAWLTRFVETLEGWPAP